MTILGVILAGGQARRFGSDKALAMLDGATLIDHVTATLTPQVDAAVVCGRDGGLIDRPAGIGPLGGIAAAVRHARDEAFAGAVTVACDTPVLPGDLVARLLAVGGAAFVGSIPVVGYWPAALADAIDDHIARSIDYSIRAMTSSIGATAITLGAPIANVNTPADLADLADRISCTGPTASR